MNNHDDLWAYWDKVTVLKKKKKTRSEATSKKALHHAQRQGQAISTTKKYRSSQNYQGKQIHAKRIDDDHESTKHKTLPRAIQQAILQGRANKNMKRDELARRCHVKTSVIAEYETKSPIPNQKLLQKIEKVLGLRFHKS